MTSQPVEPNSDVTSEMPERRQLSVRRAPKYVPFMISGVVLAFIVAAILTAVSPSTEQFATSSVLGFFFVMLLVPCVGLGAVVALIIDRRSLRRAETAVVETVPADKPNESNNTQDS